MAKKFLTHLDLAKNELQNAVIQQLASAPGSPVQGQIYYNTTDDNVYIYDGAGWVDLTLGGSGAGDVVGPSSSVDGEIALFDSTTGKLIKRATGSGIAKITSGVLSTATSGTDYAPATSGSSILKGNGSGGFSAAVSSTDYAPATSGSGILKGNGSGGFSTASAGTDYVTGSSTNTLTNKTIDANDTGNSITNLETADFASGVIDTDGTLAANSDTKLASQKAVKTYVDSAVNGLNWKDSVRIATTGAGTLATNFANGQSVDGVTLATGDRILIKDQATASENGIYVVAASGAPTRATDADSGTEIKQATVVVEEGTANADTTWTLTNNGTITLGSTNLTFALQGTGATPDATTTVKGKVELADSTEAEARSSSTLALTPSSVANFPVKKTFTIGDGSSTSIGCTHNLGTKEVISQVRQASDDAIVECDIVNTSTTVTTFSFATAPASNAIKVVIMG